MFLCQAETTNGNFPATATRAPLRDACAILYGTWGGATAKLQASKDGTNWVDLTNGSFTADGTCRVQVGEGWFVRVNIASGSGASLTVSID
jgi:hypothetical protein